MKKSDDNHDADMREEIKMPVSLEESHNSSLENEKIHKFLQKNTDHKGEP